MYNNSCLVSNFPFVPTDEIENLFGISFAENLPNSCFGFSFSPTKSLATSTRARGESKCSVLVNMQHHEVVQS